MVRSYRRHAVAFVALVALALLAPSAPTFGQGEPVAQRIDLPEYASVPDGAPTVADPAPQAAPAPSPNATVRVLLPIVRQPAAVAPVQFASQINQDTGALINPATVFNYGIADIYAATTVTGGEDQKYLMRWTINGTAQTGLDYSGTIFSSPRYLLAGVCRRRQPTFSCSNTPVAFDRGTYQVQVFLNGTLVQQGQAVIR